MTQLPHDCFYPQQWHIYRKSKVNIVYVLKKEYININIILKLVLDLKLFYISKNILKYMFNIK